MRAWPGYGEPPGRSDGNIAGVRIGRRSYARSAILVQATSCELWITHLHWMAERKSRVFVVATAHAAVRERPAYGLAYAYLEAGYAQLGMTEKAAAAARELMRWRPFVTIDWFSHAMRNPEDAAHLADGLEKAGVKSSMTGKEVRSAGSGVTDS